ncbi:MAG: hemolysin family protein [Planctomycetaceae bacterium]|nr:hemolysin family protein [Planctomycetaceae bacterium]
MQTIFYLVPLGLLVIFVFSLGARSLKLFSRHRLEEFCRRRNAEKRLAEIVKRYENVTTAVSIARILSVTLFLICFFMFCIVPPFRYAPESVHWGTVYSVLVALVFFIIFAEFWLPRALAKLWGIPFVYFGWFLWSTSATLLHPFIIADRLITLFFCRLAGHTENEDAFEEEIRTIVTEGHREGLLEGDAREMIEGVIELQDVTVSEIMTPRTDMKCIADSLSWEEMLQAVMAISHSRIPVYKETRDDIIGVLHTRNLLLELALHNPDQRPPWTELMSEPLFIPETKPVDTLLQEFQNVRPSGGDSEDRAKGHLAIVLDEYGGVAGIVTLEDVLEEIVGEITDEHDTVVTTEEIEEVSPGVFDVLGKVRIDELNSQLGLDLPEEEDYDTVAGFIFSTLGHIPEVDESVDYEHNGQKVRLTVVGVTRRRIEKVRIERNG